MQQSSEHSEWEGVWRTALIHRRMERAEKHINTHARTHTHIRTHTWTDFSASYLCVERHIEQSFSLPLCAFVLRGWADSRSNERQREGEGEGGRKRREVRRNKREQRKATREIKGEKIIKRETEPERWSNSRPCLRGHQPHTVPISQIDRIDFIPSMC